MKKILAFLCLMVLVVSLMSSVTVSAGYTVYPSGKTTQTIVLHNHSGWYTVNGQWYLYSEATCEFGDDGKVYVPVQYLSEIFGFSDAYCQEDGSTIVATTHSVKIIQNIGVDKINVNGVWYDDAAPYVASNGYVMVSLDAYTAPLGFSFEITYPESYLYGAVTLSRTTDYVPEYSRVYVNKEMQLVTVYGKGPEGNEVPLWYGVCSTGMPGQETVEGRFYLRPLSMGSYYGKWYLFVNSGIWIVNCSQIYGDYCFHSILFTRLFDPSSLNYPSFYDLGRKATNGCVRMTVEDAAFIFDNCGGLPCDIDGGYYTDELAAIKQRLMDELPDTAEEYVRSMG